MRTLTCDLLLTIDGYAAAVDAGPFFGYSGPDLDAWVHANLEQPQEVLMGRVTYEAMARISVGAADPISARMNELPKLVFSNTLHEPLAWQSTRLLSGDLRPTVEKLKQTPGDPLRTISSMASPSSRACSRSDSSTGSASSSFQSPQARLAATQPLPTSRTPRSNSTTAPCSMADCSRLCIGPPSPTRTTLTATCTTRLGPLADAPADTVLEGLS
jgi:RibD C-terminal domain